MGEGGWGSGKSVKLQMLGLSYSLIIKYSKGVLFLTKTAKWPFLPVKYSTEESRGKPAIPPLFNGSMLSTSNKVKLFAETAFLKTSIVMTIINLDGIPSKTWKCLIPL